MKTPASQASGSQESGSQAPASSQESGSQTPASSQESSSQESGSQESGSQAPASSQESGSQAPASQEPVSQAPANKELGSQAPASQELTIQAPASRRLATGALSANLSIAPASMRIAPESFSLDSVATDTTNDAATDGQYQTLTPDQSMTVGKTDGSSVTLSGSQVLDHFTNTVENFNSKGEDDYPEKNKTPQAADANGVWQLTSQSTHDYTGTYTMHGITGPQVAHVSFENDIDFDHNFTMTGALGIGTKTSGGADGVGIVFAPGDPEYATTGKTGGNLGLGGLNNAFAFVYDDFHNSGDDTSGVTDPGTGAYFGWRSTDANGVIQKVAANSNDWKAASTFDLSNRATNPLIDFKMNYDSGTHVLTIIIQNKTFTRDLTGIDTSKGYSISIAASTGDNKNDYSARIDSFTYTPKTAKVSVTVADATAGDTQVSTTTPVTANIGDTIYVFSTKAAAERAVAADPTLDPKLVTVIPASTTNSVYVVDGDQAATSNGTVHYINDDSSIADGAYYSYTVTGDASQALTVPISQAFKANVTPVDSVTGEPIPGVDPIQVTTVAGKSVVIQIPGYTPATVALAAPKDGETVGNYTVQVNTGTPVDATTTPTTSDVANPIAHYYTATGTTIDGKTVNATVTVGTNQSITDVLNGQLATDGATAGITGDDYYWSTVPNAADTDSTDKSNPQDSTSILVPTKSTLDKWIQQADDNQTQANDEKTAAQDIYDKFVASPDITDDQKAAAKSLLDSVNAVYDKLSKTNSDAKALLEAAESSTDPATIVKDSQAGYAGISGMDTSLADFKKDVDNMATTNAATQASMVTFKSWSQVYGTELEKPKADFGTGFGVTVSDADLAGLFADSGNFYYVNALDLDTAVTPKDVGAYYFKLTDAGRSYLKSLTPDNPNAGLYVSAMVTITPAAAAPTIQDATVDYGGDKGELPEIIGSLGTKVTGADDVLTQGDYEVVDTDGNVVPVDKLQAGGDYTIRYTAAAQADLKADSNYTFGDFGTAKLTVTPLDITVVAQSAGKTYGADEPALTLTDASKAGLVNGDQLSDLGVTLTRDTSKEDVGEYAGNITGSVSGANKNYTVKVTAGDFTITPAAAAPTIQDATVDYGGDKGELPEIIGSLGTKVTGADDVLTQGDYEVVDTDGNVVPVDKLQAGGDYTIRYTAAAQADLKADSNYTFGDFGTAKLTVTPLDITVVAQSAGKTYGADEPALTLTDASKAGLVNGDQLSDLGVTLTRDTSKEDVGEYAGNITGSVSGANKNYTVKVTAGDFTITPAAAAPTIQDATVDYGGDKGELPEIIGSLGTKVTGADDVLTQGDYEVVDTDGNVVPVDKLQAGGDYTIRYTAAAQADLKADSNYTFGDFGTAKLTVTPLDITVVAQSAGKTYGADEPALTLTDDSKAGLVNGDQLSDLDVTLTRDTSRENVGEYAGNITGSASGSNTNYTVKVTAGDFTITKASANVKVANVISTYGDLPKLSATVSVPNNAITLSDFEIVNADGDMVALDKLQAGDYTIQLTQAAKTGLAQENSNYDFTNPDHTSSFGTGTLTVNPRAVTIQIANQQTYAGMTNPENVAALTSDSGAFKDGEGVTDLNLTYSEPTNPAVGSYTIDATNGNTNYDVTVLPGQLTVLGKEKDAAGTTTITEKDAAGNVVKIDKQWPDGSHTTYTYDPATDKRTVSEQKDGKQVDQQELTSDSSKVTLSDDTNTSTTVTLDPTTKQPVFEHDTTQTAGDTTTTKDADGNVVKVVKQWPDGNQTTYTYDPISGDRAVTEEKDGKPVDQQKITSDDAKTTLSSGDDVKTIVNTGKPGSQPTFEHDTTQTATDDAGNVTATTKDDAGNVIDVTKQWTDGSTTTYTYDPATKTQNVTEQKDGKTVDQKTITPDAPKATLSTGNGVETIVNAPKPGAEPTFDHETTKTDGDTTTTKDADGNVVKVVKQWPDDSQTTYTYDPASGDRTVTEQKDGKTDEQPIAKDTNKATVSAVDGAKTIVNAGQPGSQPTFEHDTTQTTTDKAGNVTATTKDDAGNVIDVTKQWTDGSTTKYTYDPATKTQTVTEQKDGKTVDQKTITPDAPKATLSTGNGVETTVNAPKPGAEPTFDHETTKTDGDTTTTKDANGNVVKVVKQWPDDSQTTYTYDPITGDRAVTEQKDGKPVDQQKITSDDEKTTLSSGDDVKTIVNTGKPGSQPTFEHDTTHTATDKYGNTTATTKDTDGNVVKVVKQWTDGSQTTYTFDPATGKQTVTEQKDGKTVDQKTITPDKPKATLASGDGAETIVNTGKPGAEPTFEHDTTQTTTDKSGNVTTTTKDADGNVVKITKQWIDGSKTIYTSDPKTGKQTVIEQKDGKTVDEKTITPDAKATLASGDGAETIVTAGQPGTEPTFEHDATKTTTTTDKAGNVTTTTKDADGNVIKVTEQWTDGSVTTYTYDPVTGKRVVTEQRDGKVVDQQTIDPDATKATLSSGAGVETIVNAGQPGSQPTFEHETIKTTTDKSGNVTATTTDANGNAVKVTKQWTDGSKTTYTYDPATGKRTVTEQRDGKTVDQQTIDPNASEVTLVDGAGGKVIVNFGKAGAEPSFTRQLAATGRRQVTVQKADDNQGKRASKQAKPVVQGKKSAQSATTNEVAGDVAVTGRVQAQPKAKSNQKQTELPQTGQKNESLLAEVGVVLLALLAVPFIRRRSH